MSSYEDKQDLQRDLYLMVKAGLLDIRIREDGEWVYHVTEKSLNMTEEEREEILNRLDDYEDMD